MSEDRPGQTERGFLGRSWSRIGLYAFLLGMVVFYLIPIETGLATSIKTEGAFTGRNPYLPPLPWDATLASWSDAFLSLLDGLVNSLILVIPATVLSGLLGSMAAYGLTTISWRGQVGIYSLFVAGIFIPYQAVLVPLTVFWYNIVPIQDWWLESVANGISIFGLFEIPSTFMLFGWELGLQPYHWQLISLIITHTAYGIPICALLFRAHYKKLPDEMVEAARLDGASIRRIYRRIILPLSVPMFAVVFIYQFTQIWNDLLFALILVQNNEAAVVTQQLIDLGAAQEGIDYPLRMAGAFVAALPTLLVYVVFGDKFAKGVAA